MLSKLLLLVIFSICSFCRLHAGEADEDLRQGRKCFKLSIHAGYEKNELAEMKSFFNSLLGELKAEGVNMPDQAVYPYSPGFGGSILFSIKEGMFFGIKFEHAASKAFSLYGDNAGTIDIISKIEFNKIGIAGQYVIDIQNEYFSPFFEMNLGLLFLNYDFSAKTVFTPSPRWIAEEKVTAKDYTHVISVHAGLQHSIYRNIILFEKIGYQFAELKGMPANLYNNGITEPIKLGPGADLRGTIFQIGIGLQF